MLPKKYRNMTDFLSQHKYDKYIFRWINVPIKKYYQYSMAEHLQSPDSISRYCKTMKMMVRRKAWLADSRAIIDPHRLSCRGTSKLFEDSSSNGDSPFLIHFLVRNHLHTVAKILEQRLPTEKGKTLKSDAVTYIKGNPLLKSYPFRIYVAVGEYHINSRKYLENGISRWRIPDINIDKSEKRQEDINILYTDIFKKYGILPTEPDINILEKDIYNLEQKIEKPLSLLNTKYKNILNNKMMPSVVGKTLQTTFFKEKI